MATNEEVLAALSSAFPDLTNLRLIIIAGQKRVYQAQRSGHTIALKAILVGEEEPEDGGDPEVAEALTASAARLQREIEILRGCRSAHIVSLSDPPFTELSVGGERYGVYAEEWIDGEDLRTIIRKGVLARNDVIDLSLALCAALEELDAKGYVHRDVKPANIMRRIDGTYLLVDPGMALDRAGPSLTEPGGVPGTAPYMSPEQWDVRRKRDLDVRSDMFAVGAVLFEALTGKHPFYDPGMSQLEIMTATRTKQPRKLEHADLKDDDPLGDVILRLLARNPHGRYRDTAALRAALEAAR